MGKDFTKSIKRRDNIFGESVIVGSGKRPSLPQVEGPRWLFLLVLLLVFTLVGVGRLVDLQLVRGSYFRALADGNRIRRIPIRAPRGEITDRNGVLLARNVPLYKLAEFSSGGVVIKTEDITREEALQIQASDSEKQNRLITDIAREYPLGRAAAHLLGYAGQANEGEVGGDGGCGEKVKQKLILGDLVGRMGVEAQYDCLLRGIDGEELVEVDTRGRLVRKLGKREAVAGQTIKLSIDAKLQSAAYDALESVQSLSLTVGGAKFEGGETPRGALVAESPENGEILALVSVPSFDPSTIAADYNQLAQDSNLPLFNRAIGGAYHPGSTFKIVTSVAAVEDGKINKDYTFTDTGSIRVGDFSYSNWYFTQYGRTEGEIKLPRAITRSTDTFFYKAGELVGPERMAFWAERLGLGAKTGIDLPGEVPGLVPNPDWKLRTKGERWFLGNTYHMAIGQGDVAASPLQMVGVTSVIASGGKLCSPHVVLGDKRSLPLRGKGDKGDWGCKDTGIKRETLDLIREGMLGACASGGTGFPFFNFKPQVACKTGTAQTVGEKTHAWFTVYAPTASQGDALQGWGGKQIVVTALVEEGGEGSRVAAPVVREVLKSWFSEQ